jgi:hypothetical protein
MDTLRVFIRWLESIDGVEQDLSLKVRSLDVTTEENTRDVMLDTDTTEAMLEYLERYEYASLHHVTVSLLWHTMMRMGAGLAGGALDTGCVVNELVTQRRLAEVHSI